MRSLDAPFVAPRRRLWWTLYVIFVLGVAALHSVAALQDYRRGGGQRDWEPVLWEFSAVFWVGVLGLAVYAWVGHLRGRPWPQKLAAHVLGALAFSLLHFVCTFSLRLAFYAAMGLDDDTGPLPKLLVQEGAKNLVSYSVIVMVSWGVWAIRASQQREQELAQARTALAEARLARLAEQVQPHFMFNSLNLISSVMYEDVDRADHLLCELAALLRQTTAAQQVGEHRLEDELALVQPFMTLMQARFGPERLTVRIDASPEARAARLPALLLLAPVENAIKHDVAQHSGLVTVHLQAAVVAGELHLTVDNSGVQQPGTPDGGTGLHNLRERLRVRYGDAARVHFGPGQGGMRLAMALPLEVGAAS